MTFNQTQEELKNDKVNEYIYNLKIVLTASGYELTEKDLLLFEEIYKQGYDHGKRDLLKDILTK